MADNDNEIPAPQRDPEVNPQPAEQAPIDRLQDVGRSLGERIRNAGQGAMREAQAQSVALLRDPVAARMVALLEGIDSKLAKVAEGGGERQEMPPPGIFKVWPNPLTTHVRIRVTKLIIASLALQTLQVRIGAFPPLTVRIAADSTQSIDLPIVVDRGVQISLIDTTTGVAPVAANVVDAAIIGYPE